MRTRVRYQTYARQTSAYPKAKKERFNLKSNSPPVVHKTNLFPTQRCRGIFSHLLPLPHTQDGKKDLPRSPGYTVAKLEKLEVFQVFFIVVPFYNGSRSRADETPEEDSDEDWPREEGL